MKNRFVWQSISFSRSSTCRGQFCSTQQQHMYSTYGQNSYGNLDPNSISYALVTPDIYNANQTMTLHSAMMRPASIQNSQLSPTGSAFYARTLPPNLSMFSFILQYHLFMNTRSLSLSFSIFFENPIKFSILKFNFVLLLIKEQDYHFNHHHHHRHYLLYPLEHKDTTF